MTDSPDSKPANDSSSGSDTQKSTDVFDKTQTFKDLGLRDSVLRGIEEMGFVHPTDIQAQLIPPVLAGHDVIGQAKTGTGKTASFGLPIINNADKDIPMQALILVPTRELAAQVSAELEDIGKYTPIRPTCIIGGESMKKQADSIKKAGHIMVGTPGRVMDMFGRRMISFKDVRFAVLDEVDRMLDIGFRDDIRQILQQVKSDHQTLFVSATMDAEIERLARKFMKKDAQKILTVSGSLTVSQVDQKHIPVEPWDKRSLLLHMLRHEDPDTTVVFCRTKATVDKLVRYLNDKKIQARSIHGDMPQNKRTKVMDSMRSGDLNVLIASDLAARGLDIDHITHVVNYDLPEDPEVYVHRIGRTARAGRQGTAWAFVTPEEGQRLTEIEKLTGVLIERLDYPDFKPGPIPDDMRSARRDASARPTSVVDKIAARTEQGPSPLDGLSEEEIKARFPDGKIPKSMPKRTLGSRSRGRRGR